MPVFPFVFVPPFPLVSGTLITEIDELAIGSIKLIVTDNTVGNYFIGQLNLLDAGSENDGTIDGRFWGAPEGGNYIPEPPMLGLMGLGLLPLIRRRLMKA